MIDTLSKIATGRFGVSKSYFLGLLLGLQVPYPTIPFYNFAFLAFVIAMLDIEIRVSWKKVVLAFALVSWGLLSTTFSPRPDVVTLVRALTTTLFFLLFLFAYAIRDMDKFIRGYTVLGNVASAALVLAYFATRQYQWGMQLLLPQHRSWGEHMFPDWPNFLAFYICLVFLLNALYLKRPWLASLNLVAALLTTSRGVLVALAAFWLARCIRSRRVAIASAILVCIAATAITGIFLFTRVNKAAPLLERLSEASDRQELYKFSLNMAANRPVLGYGSILMDESVGNSAAASFHNSYLDLLIRFGSVGLLLFLALIYPPRVWAKQDFNYVYFAVAVLFLCGAFFNNFLKHPHLFMFFAAWVTHYRYFLREPAAEAGESRSELVPIPQP